MEKLDRLRELLTEVNKIVADDQLFDQIKNETFNEKDAVKVKDDLQCNLELFVASKAHFSQIVYLYNNIRISGTYQ